MRPSVLVLSGALLLGVIGYAAAALYVEDRIVSDRLEAAARVSK